MPNYNEQLDQVFQALTDPTRRNVLERLSRGPASTLELAREFDMALPSFIQHLNVLERFGLVKSKKLGRVRTYELSPKRMEAAEVWISKQRKVWEKRLNQLDTYLLTMKESDDDNQK